MSQPIAALQSLKATLEDLQARGQERIWISPEATAALKSLPDRIRAQRVPSEAAAPGSPDLAITARSASGPALNPAGESPAEKLASLRAIASDWQPARELGSLRDTMVFAVGNPSADLMLVGEAPGIDEERQGEPFVGKAGQLLTKIIQTMGLQRSDIYISNICKFRPAMPDQGTGNRKPTSQEMEACLPFVLTEIDIVRPRVIVALGGTAAEGLLGLTEPVSRTRNRFHDFNGIPAMVTYHPSYLLRNQALGERRKVWEDMLLVMERLEMPISQKQRDFFLK